MTAESGQTRSTNSSPLSRESKASRSCYCAFSVKSSASPSPAKNRARRVKASLLAALPHPGIVVSSQAPDRRTYLMRPDRGRALDPASTARLEERAGAWDLAIVIADGLSATGSPAPGSVRRLA